MCSRVCIVLFLYCSLLCANAQTQIGSRVDPTKIAISSEHCGRFGNEIITYLVTKWLAHKYDLPFLYVPFVYADQFAFHEQEKNLRKDWEGQFQTAVYIDSVDSIPHLPPSTLLLVNCFKAKTKQFPFRSLLSDPGFRSFARTLLQQVRCPIEQVQVPQGKLSVLAHVRMGGGYDPRKRQLSYPKKFPPHSYYISSIETLSELFYHQPMYVFIMTDDPCPEEIARHYRGALAHLSNVEIDFRKGESGPSLNVLDDFFSVSQFDCLIRADSSFTIAASLLAEFKAEIWPKKCHVENEEVVVDELSMLVAKPKLFLFQEEQMRELQKRAYANDAALQPALNALIEEADSLLDTQVYSVMDKTVMPPSNDKHDYLSVARYWWPDPLKENGLPYVMRDGEVNPEIYSEAFDYHRMSRMRDRCTCLCLAYYFTGNAKYARVAASLVRAWFLNEETRMNPNLTYSQYVPGSTKSDRHAGIIELHRFPELFDCISLLTGSKLWTADDKAGLLRWAKEYFHWLKESPQGQKERQAMNNHASWYDVQAVYFALYTGQNQIAEEHLIRNCLPKLQSQFTEDGRQPFELKRRNSFEYSVFNLEALFTCAMLAEQVGLDLWHIPPRAPVLKKALDWLVPYAVGTTQWVNQDIVPLSAAKLGPLLLMAHRVYKERGYPENYLEYYLENYLKFTEHCEGRERLRLFYPSIRGR